MLLLFNIKLYLIYLDTSEYKKHFKKINEINNWIDLCKKKILIRGILKSSKKPKITALITIYNSKDYIDTAIKSVQNQLFSDIEILLVNDASTDESSKIIKILKEEDQRINSNKNYINKNI